MTQINADTRVRVVMDTARMDWAPSPSGTVWRKRLHLSGQTESGQVTSIVRYEPNSAFPPHDHPDGEEILVLQGVFSDEHGDWPVGTYLLNPEGFRHAPFSREGCVLFVKLRQYAGAGRVHVATDTARLCWEKSAVPAIETKPLYADSRFEERMRLERWAPGAESVMGALAGGAELLVIRGSLTDQHGEYAAGTWLRLPDGSEMRLASRDGCELYLKLGGVAGLDGTAQGIGG